MENFRHESPKNRHYIASVTVLDTIMDWASWIVLRDGLSKPSQINVISDNFKPSR